MYLSMRTQRCLFAATRTGTMGPRLDLNALSSGAVSILALLLALGIASVALAAPGLKAGGLTEFKVELPGELRQLPGRGERLPVTHALVMVAAPQNFDAARDWPVMVVSATSDRPWHSSRSLLRAYADIALASGWILLAADPAEEVSVEQDDVALRFALNRVALATLELSWPGASKAPLAFGGFSGGSKYSGWLAAAFANQGRTIMGIYVAGINRNAIADAAQHFKILNETYRRIPVFLQSGETDEVSTPDEHRAIYDELEHLGFKHLRIEYFPGPHEINPRPLRLALDWFRELAAQAAPAR